MSEIDRVLVDRGRPGDVGAEGVVGPLLLAGRRVEGVDLRVPVGEIDRPERQRRGRPDPVAGAIAPLLLAARSIDGVEIPVGTPDEEVPVTDGRCAHNLGTTFEPPRHVARFGVQCVDPALLARLLGVPLTGQVVTTDADVDGAADHLRGPADEPVRFDVPYDIARIGIEGVDVPVIGTDVDGSVGNGRGAFDAVIGLKRPRLLARFGVDGVEVGVGAPGIDRAVGDHGTAPEVVVGREGPLDGGLFDVGRVGRVARIVPISAELRPSRLGLEGGGVPRCGGGTPGAEWNGGGRGGLEELAPVRRRHFVGLARFRN